MTEVWSNDITGEGVVIAVVDDGKKIMYVACDLHVICACDLHVICACDLHVICACDLHVICACDVHVFACDVHYDVRT